MVDKFKTGEFHIINGVLQTAHSLFKRLVKKKLVIVATGDS